MTTSRQLMGLSHHGSHRSAEGSEEGLELAIAAGNRSPVVLDNLRPSFEQWLGKLAETDVDNPWWFREESPNRLRWHRRRSRRQVAPLQDCQGVSHRSGVAGKHRDSRLLENTSLRAQRLRVLFGTAERCHHRKVPPVGMELCQTFDDG
jgi:hypothetical protein